MSTSSEVAVLPEEDEKEDDVSYYCDRCKSSFKIQCDVHGPPVFALDSPCPMGTPQRALLSLPAGLVVGRSRIREGSLGVFNQGPVVPVGMHFGPYSGELTTEDKALKSIYSWVISRGKNCYEFMDATRDTHSNWMRFVMCSRSNREQNLVAFQQAGRVLFRCCAPIRLGQELLVWYSEEYVRGLGLTWDQMWNNKLSSNTTNTDTDSSQALACPYCHFSFPVKPYLQRHIRRSHAEEYQNFLETHSVESEEMNPPFDLDTCLLGSDVPPPEQMEPITDTEAPCQMEPQFHRSNSTRCWNGTGDAPASVPVGDEHHHCSVCGQAFTRAYHLKCHIDAVHALDKQYWYKRSHRSLRKPSNPRRHQLSPETGMEREEEEEEEQRTRDDGKVSGAPLEVYPCGQCFIAFMSLPSLQEHMALQHAQGQRSDSQVVESGTDVSSTTSGAFTEVPVDLSDPSDPTYEPPSDKGNMQRGAFKAGIQKRGRGRPRTRAAGPTRPTQPKQKPPQITEGDDGEAQPQAQSQVCPHCGETTTGASHNCCSSQSLPSPQPGAETQTQSAGTQLTCDECQRMFADAASLQTHECVQVGEGLYSCPQCSLSFSQPSNLRRHQRTVHALMKPYCCGPCGKFYTQASGLRRHQEGRQHKRKWLACARTSANANANANVATDTPIVVAATAATAIYSCTYCQFSFTTQRFLHKHIKRHHPAEFMQEVENEDALGGGDGSADANQEEEVAELSQKCSQCEKTFFSVKGFKLHRCFRRGKPVYPCTMCSKRFSNLYGLRQHARTHTGEKPYSCKHCPKSFAVSGQLNVHLRTHTGERPYLCAQCGKGFRQSGDLKRHEQKHLGVRPHRCPQCSKRFSRPQSLRAHLQIHSGVRFFHCTQCSKAFTRRYHLTRHLHKMHSS